MLRVGLTGGVGSGKSTVCGLFADFGVPIVDADLIARQLVDPGSDGLAAIVNIFGAEILTGDGSLNRAEMRKLVFADAQKRHELDAIMHPRIYAAIEIAVSQLQADYCVIAIPLLVETRKTQMVDRVLVVDCPESMQLQRISTRDRIDEQEAAAMIASQVGRQQRLDAADDVIDNSNRLSQLAEQVKSLHNSYFLLATTRKSSA
jgi:dephospho-CoA kinase